MRRQLRQTAQIMWPIPGRSRPPASPYPAPRSPHDITRHATYLALWRIRHNAKYVTKTLNATGLPDRRIKLLADISRLRCHRHYKQMMTTAWHLADDQAAGDDRYRKWAHALGYGGHWVTKSRRYSVTFGQLRRARADHRRLLRNPQGERDPWGRPLDETVVLVLKVWSYAGTGCTVAADAELALGSAARALAH